MIVTVATATMATASMATTTVTAATASQCHFARHGTKQKYNQH
jgi:hypothetical protein